MKQWEHLALSPGMWIRLRRLTIIKDMKTGRMSAQMKERGSSVNPLHPSMAEVQTLAEAYVARCAQYAAPPPPYLGLDHHHHTNGNNSNTSALPPGGADPTSSGHRDDTGGPAGQQQQGHDASDTAQHNPSSDFSSGPQGGAVQSVLATASASSATVAAANADTAAAAAAPEASDPVAVERLPPSSCSSSESNQGRQQPGSGRDQQQHPINSNIVTVPNEPQRRDQQLAAGRSAISGGSASTGVDGAGAGEEGEVGRGTKRPLSVPREGAGAGVGRSVGVGTGMRSVSAAGAGAAGEGAVASTSVGSVSRRHNRQVSNLFTVKSTPAPHTFDVRVRVVGHFPPKVRAEREPTGCRVGCIFIFFYIMF